MRDKFNGLDTRVRVILYSGVSTFLGTLLILLQGGKEIDLNDFLIVPVGVAINLMAYLLAREAK